MTIYYWEHRHAESRYHRSPRAQSVAAIAAAQPDCEIGVIVDTPRGLVIRVVPRLSSIRATAAALAAAGQGIAEDYLRASHDPR